MARRLKAGVCLVACWLAAPWTALAADNVLLIQTGPKGFTIWHNEGDSRLEDDEILEIMVTATPEGGEVVATTLGPARAYEIPEATLIRLLAVRGGDDALLVERDACGHVKAWHAAGKAQLTEEQVTEAVLTALPGGGRRLMFGDNYAKGFIGPLGVTLTLWPVLHRPQPGEKSR